MLGHAAHMERERATRSIQTFVSLLEPALIVIFGGMVALVAAALLQALYSVRPGA
jgi:type II secretory pathway component PulF